MIEKKNKIVVGHQPQYFPYLGTYNKILQSEKFMVLDNVNFKRTAWQARTIIKDRNDNVIPLIIPCKKSSATTKIKDIKVSDHRWKKKHLNIIKNVFKNTKYFDEIFEVITLILSQKSEFVSDYSIPSIKIFLEKLGYSKDMIFIQSKEEEIEGKKNDFLINLTKKLGGNEYLSGQGAKDYIDENIFYEKNISHRFNNFEHPQYLQFGKSFIYKLSIIDAAFNIGFEGLKKIIK
ncbi:WbqC family protein [Candidatus Pelagibacter ubique]|nr:WbqC family protein [Candidatus Pelagibacter ubique]